jgi:hypothetical protein
VRPAALLETGLRPPQASCTSRIPAVHEALGQISL